MKKLLHELSIDDLLKSLEGQDLSKESIAFSYDNPVASFAQAFELKAGKELVCDKVLHALFKLWYKDKSFDQRAFNLQLVQFVPSVMKARRYFLLNKSALDIVKKAQEIDKKKSRPRSKSLAWCKHFESFLDDTGLKPGKVFVELDILYYLYNNWCDDTRKKAWLGYQSFGDMCSLNFEKKRVARNTISWYGVNNKVKELITKEEVERWRLGRKKYGSKKKNNDDIPYPKYRNETLYPKTKVKKK